MSSRTEFTETAQPNVTAPSPDFEPAGRPGRVMSTEDVASLVVLCLTMVLAIAGNLRLIVYIRQTWRLVGRIMRINFFLINLAVGDICVGAVVCSGELLFIAFGQWELGPIMCKLVVYVQFVCLASSAFLLLAMTVDRYEVIVQPLRAFRRDSRVARRILACWLCALVFAIPQLLIFKQTTVVDATAADNSTLTTRCESEGYTEPWQRKIYLLYVLLVVVVFPTLAMVYCYGRIVHAIWQRTRTLPVQSTETVGADSPSRLQQEQQAIAMTPVLMKSNSGQQQFKQGFNGAAGTRVNGGGGGGLCIDRAGGCERNSSGSGGGSGGGGSDGGGCRCNHHAQLSIASTQGGQPSQHPMQLLQQQQQQQQQQSNAWGGSRLLSRAKIKAVFMSLCVVVAFLLCWLPYFLALMLNVYSDGRLLRHSLFLTVAEKLVLLHSVLNPILYFMFATRSTVVAQLCTSCVRCCKCCCRLSNEASIYAPSSGGRQAVQHRQLLQTRRNQRSPQRAPPAFFGDSSASYDMLNNRLLAIPQGHLHQYNHKCVCPKPHTVQFDVAT